MGKFPSYSHTDSDETINYAGSIENLKKKKKFSILKNTSSPSRKKKCKIHSKSEPDDSDYGSRSRSGQRIRSPHRLKSKGILKHTKHESSDDSDSTSSFRPQSVKDRCLVGRVPLPPGAKPGRGGGVAIVVRKEFSTFTAQPSAVDSKKHRKGLRRLMRKSSY